MSITSGESAGQCLSSISLAKVLLTEPDTTEILKGLVAKKLTTKKSAKKKSS